MTISAKGTVRAQEAILDANLCRKRWDMRRGSCKASETHISWEREALDAALTWDQLEEKMDSSIDKHKMMPIIKRQCTYGTDAMYHDQTSAQRWNFAWCIPNYMRAYQNIGLLKSWANKLWLNPNVLLPVLKPMVHWRPSSIREHKQ